MQITIEIPDELVSSMLATAQHDRARAALEAIAVEAYREHRLTGYQLRELLGIRSRYEMDGLLKRHQVWLDYSMDDFERILACTRRSKFHRSIRNR
jgi:Uncharacterised protein family (UPF0175)